MNNKKTLGIYIRVSTIKQSEKGLSADNQKESGIALAKQLGWNYKLYDDRGVSASRISFKDRHLSELIQDCKDGVLEGIYCVDIDRWSRDKNYEEGQVIITLIKESGVKVFTQTGEFKLDDPSTEFLMRLKSLFASFETLNRVASIKRNLKKSAEMGRAKGGAYLPYGYKKNENKLLVIDEEEAKVVRKIYKLAFEGKGKGTLVIARMLNEQGIPTKIMNTGGSGMLVRGEKKTTFLWRDKTVLGILKNPIYKGERIHKGEVVPAPVIIEPEFWDAVQIKVKNRNQYKDTNNLYQYLLKGLILCPKCGSKIQGKKRANGKDNCYTCTSNRNGPNCGNRGINIECLNEIVTDNVLQMDKVIEAGLNDAGLVNKIAQHNRRLKERNNKIAELKKKQEKYLDAIIEGITSKEVLKNRLGSIELSIAALEQRNALEQKSLGLIQQKEALLTLAKEAIQRFKTLKTFDDKAGFLAEVIKVITVRWVEENNAYDIVITFKFDQLENYLISKEILIDRNGRKDGKAINKILSERITVESLLVVDEDSNVMHSEPLVEYTDLHSLNSFNTKRMKKSKTAQ